MISNSRARPFESARLHLDIPTGVVAILFVVKFNPGQATILKGLWNCTPTCCVQALGNGVCAGESIHLDTDQEALSYQWSGPNGFFSTERDPVIANASALHTGWYVVEASWYFGCVGIDSVYIEVKGEELLITPDTARICPGATTHITATGAIIYNWDSLSPGFLSSQNGTAQVQPCDYHHLSGDWHGCFWIVSIQQKLWSYLRG